MINKDIFIVVKVFIKTGQELGVKMPILGSKYEGHSIRRF